MVRDVNVINTIVGGITTPDFESDNAYSTMVAEKTIVPKKTNNGFIFGPEKASLQYLFTQAFCHLIKKCLS